jgi:hypothetical protein
MIQFEQLAWSSVLFLTVFRGREFAISISATIDIAPISFRGKHQLRISATPSIGHSMPCRCLISAHDRRGGLDGNTLLGNGLLLFLSRGNRYKAGLLGQKLLVRRWTEKSKFGFYSSGQAYTYDDEWTKSTLFDACAVFVREDSFDSVFQRVEVAACPITR